jgi:hypothetical protein
MKVVAIHLAPGRRLPMRPVAEVVAEAGSVFRVLGSGTFAVGDQVELTDQ